MSEALALVDECWNRIGVSGDRSCPELKAVIHCRNCPIFMAASQRFFDRELEPGYEHELTALLATTASRSDQGSFSALTFLIGDEAFALETRWFVEVTEELAVHRVPHRSSRVFAGMVNIHGQLELCFSLAGLLDTDPVAPDPNARRHARMVVLADEQGGRWVFRADAVVGVEVVARGTLAEAPSTLVRKSQNFVSRVFALGERHVGLLDAQALLAALERSLR